jgi:hypothetical protein
LDIIWNLSIGICDFRPITVKDVEYGEFATLDLILEKMNDDTFS